MQESPDLSEARLRILATSDLHMNVEAETGRAASGGLARVATLIAERTKSAPGHCLIVDNGDFLQGTQLSDYLAETVKAGATHPLATAFNAIGYTAIGLGNHDLDYGLPLLSELAGQLTSPLISANLTPITPQPWMQPSIIVQAGPICVGISSGLPISTAGWAHTQLHDRARVSDLLAALRRESDQLRRNGADVVLVLAHSGFARTSTDQDNLLGEICASEICDLLVGGHTHTVFPDPGKTHKTNAAMLIPGFGGHWLGEFNLVLNKPASGQWAIADIETRVQPVGNDIPEDPKILRIFQTAATRAHRQNAQVIGRSPVPLTSYFATIAPNAAMSFTANSQRLAIESARIGTQFEDLPVLSAVSPGKSGGLYGPAHYTDIPAGDVTTGDLYELQEHMNDLWAIAVFGHEIEDWLERSAAQFTHMVGTDAKLIIREDAPAFNVDTLFGLTYQIDPRKPSKYAIDGTVEDPAANRIIDIRHNGKTIAPSDRFLVAASSFRLCGGGNFPGLTPDRVAFRTQLTVRQLLADYCCAGTLGAVEQTWSFAPADTATLALFRTGPKAVAHLQEIAHLTPGRPKDAPGGFIDIPITI